MTILIAQAVVTEPPPAGWEHGADFAVRKTAEHPDVVFPLLAILGPVLVGFALIWAAVKFGLPFVREQLEAFRKHTTELLTQRSEDAAGDIAAARALASSQHDALVQRVEAKIDRQTGELQKISERSERHGELLRDVARKAGVVALVLILVACPAPLSTQQTLAQRVHRASQACVALPIGPDKARVCADALLCQSTAQAAAEALQKAQTATATGTTDVSAEASAAGQSVLADAACRRGGW